MLLLQYLYEIGELPRFRKARKEEVLLQPLMVVLYKPANQPCRLR